MFRASSPSLCQPHQAQYQRKPLSAFAACPCRDPRGTGAGCGQSAPVSDPNADLLKQAIARRYADGAGSVCRQQPGRGAGAHFSGAAAALGADPFPTLPTAFTRCIAVCTGLPAARCRLPTISASTRQTIVIRRRPWRHHFPNPNAPTGRLLPLAAIEQMARARPDCVIVVDEAYIDFGGDTAVPLTQRYDNILVIHTLSKSRALAGLRGMRDRSAGADRSVGAGENSFNSIRSTAWHCGRGGGDRGWGLLPGEQRAGDRQSGKTDCRSAATRFRGAAVCGQSHSRPPSAS